MKLSGNKPKRPAAAKESEAAPREKKVKNKNRGGLIALITGLVIVAAAAGGAAYGVSRVNEMDTVFPNVTVDGLDVGGLSLSETAELLERSGYDNIGDNAVTVELPLDVYLTVRADEVCTETPVSDIALMAYDACKGGSKVQNALTYLRCRSGGMELESGSVLTVDEDAVRAKVDAAAKQVQQALLGSDLKIGEESIAVRKGATGVTIDTDSLTGQVVKAFREHQYETIQYEAAIETDAELDVQALYDTVFTEKADAYLSEDCEIIPEVRGISFDMDEAEQAWNAAGYGEEVLIPLAFDEPEVTAADLEALLFRDQLSSMSTSLAGSSSNRVNNVTKAAASINGIILMPGDEFSYNPALGERTAENGYLTAGAYSGGEVVQEYGGGICQVSSTLYYCCLYANLKITSRTCHYFPVSYLPAGLDATVSWGGPEFKFVNNREYPIKIVAGVDEMGKNVTVELWGTDTDGTYVEMTYGTWIVFDDKYPDVAIGYKAQTYRSVYAADGTLLSRKDEANSFYHYHPEDIKWPEEPEETEPPAETAPPQPEETPTPGGDAQLPPGETPPLVTESDPAPTEPTEPVGEAD